MYKQPKHIIRFFAFALFLGYMLALLPLFHVHEEHGHKHGASHTAEVHQTDDCHNFIYHGKTDGQAHDHEHILASELDCFTCQFFKNQPKIVVSEFVDEAKTQFAAENQFSFQNEPYKSELNFGFVRGPPAVA